ncbi:methionine synthase [Nocardioides zeae]|uniref:Methionine synthase n=1 Tax=Nocardioides imazamoxiresistens TaxID=3231893 RepID=A0ABU3PRF9_9ACTN|nr:methionine synthase [Nocardioides zeae]MDT9591819.1 methionine synthase [Nocardioides zeae]
MTFATAAGSHPGEDQHAFDTALGHVLDVLGDAPGLPYLPEVPGRGAGAAMTGRTLAWQTGLDADLQPAGWRLTGTSGAPGRDQRRARSLLLQDLDSLEERAQGYAGDLKLQLAGPWTLAATTERPRGDKLVADHAARRDLAQSLAEAAGELVAEARRRVPGVVRVVVQVDEPALTAVRDARIPTASGFGRHRSVDVPELSEGLGWVLGAVADAGGEPWVHACAPGTPWSLVHGAGARALVVDPAVLDATALEQVAEAYDAGAGLVLGVADPLAAEAPRDRDLADRARRWLDTLGLGPGDGFGVGTACGLAGTPVAAVPRHLSALRDAARRLDD